jgi:hypothetical protein
VTGPRLARPPLTKVAPALPIVIPPAPAPAPAASGLPVGVSLRQIDGGPQYFARFHNSFPSDPSFFPIAVFNQTLGYNPGRGSWDPRQLDAYKRIGVNTFANLYNGYDPAMVRAIRGSGMYFIDHPPAHDSPGSTMAGYVWFDEADGNNDCGEIPSASVLGESVSCSPVDGRTPAGAIDSVNQRLNQLDPTRPVYCQYTKPVAELEGLNRAGAAAYVNAHCGIVSFDSYTISDGWERNHDLWRQYDDVARVRSLASYAFPVWPFIEAGEPFPTDACGVSSQWSGVRPTPAMEVAEAWNAVIAGARGIQWFDHSFSCGGAGYPSSAQTLIDRRPAYAGLQAAVRRFDSQVQQLAAVLNGPSAVGYLTAVSNPNPDSEDGRSVNYLVKYDRAHNRFYLFVAPTTNAPESITFTTAGGYSGAIRATRPLASTTATVLATRGTFADSFTGQTDVHEYVVPGPHG